MKKNKIMDIKYWQEIQNNDTVKKRLAKVLARYCFRNTKLEDFHADDRLDNDEMKELMVDVVNHCYDFLQKLSDPRADSMIESLKHKDNFPNWNEPKEILHI